MSISMARKRKVDESLGAPDSPSSANLKRFHPTVHTIQIPIMTDNEDEAFPSDRITSDPTFFDDFMPEERQTLPQSALTSCLGKQTSPVTNTYRKPSKSSGKSAQEIRSLPNLGEHGSSDYEDADATAPVEPAPRDLERTTDFASQNPQLDETISRSPRKRDHHNLLQSDQEELMTVTQEETDLNSLEGVSDFGRVSILPQRADFGAATARAQTGLVSPVREQTRTTSTVDTARETSLSRADCPKEIESKDNSRSSFHLTSMQPICSPNSISVRTSNAVPRTDSGSYPSKTNTGPKIRLNTPNFDAIETSSKDTKAVRVRTARRYSSKGTHSETDGLEFEIAYLRADSAYSVKHRKETKSETGNKWSSAVKRTSIYHSITKHARVTYTVGDIVSLNFPEGDGGSAKIVEVRDTNTPFIVIQWLYSRTDAARLGGRLPSLEKWPKGFYMLSDHFQVVCVENLNGKSGSTPIEDLYWQISRKCLRPADELNGKLKDQLA